MPTGKSSVKVISAIIVVLMLLVATELWAATYHQSETITSNTTWTSGGNDHIVTGYVKVMAGVTLTIQDGCEVKLDDAAYIRVYGTLNAYGTSGDGILFTRRSVGDDWEGLQFRNGSDGMLRYCTIEYATASGEAGIAGRWGFPSIEHCTIRNNYYGILASSTTPVLSVSNTIRDNSVAGLYITNCTNSSISNQTITGHSGTYGAIYMYDTGEFHLGTGNNITGNSWGLTMTVRSYPDASSDGNIPTSGNTNDDGLQVYGGDLSSSITWHDVGAAYIVTEYPEIEVGGILTIEDGCVVKFEDQQFIRLSGTLNADGTSGDGIVFTQRDVGDNWTGLKCETGSNVTLRYSTIEGAGGTGDAGVYCDGVFPSIEHCTIRNNYYGIVALNTTPVLSVANTIRDNTIAGVYCYSCTNPSISNQTMTGHNGIYGAIYMYYTGEFHMGPGNNITGNSWGLTINMGSYPDASSYGNIPTSGNTNDDGLQVYGGYASGSVTWPVVGADYVITQYPSVQAGGTLTIEDGCVVKFDNQQHMQVLGTLNAYGSSGEGILFTRRDVDDNWAGLKFGSSSGGTLRYCTIEGAGATNHAGVLCDGTSLFLEHCAIHNNYNGMEILSGSPRITNCFIVNNDVCGVKLDGLSTPIFGANSSQWNDIYNNGSGSPESNLRNGDADINARYIYWGTVVETEIEGCIVHEPDNPVLGEVDYDPWTNEAHGDLYVGVPTDREGDVIPHSFSLEQNHPNPAYRETGIKFALPRDCWVRLEIFDVSGRSVVTLLDEFQQAGLRTLRWDTSQLAAGAYFYQIQAGEFVQTRKMIVAR